MERSRDRKGAGRSGTFSLPYGRGSDTPLTSSDALMCSASVGHTQTHRAQLTQSSGRGIHGRGPSIARQSVGQTATQSAQPVQCVASSTGKAAVNSL